MSQAVKRACDACHRRKVKCDGINPCRNCASAQLTCTYNAIPQKKGPKGSRAKVISELRETQRQTSLSAKVQSRLNGLSSPQCSPTLQPTPGLLASEMAKECIEFFFANMYPIMPILHRQRLEQQSMYLEQSLDTYCLITSLCAWMMFQPGMNVPGADPLLEHLPGANIASGMVLIEETIRVRKGCDYQESPSLNTLCTSYFLFCSHYALDMHDKAWFYLREATTLAHIIGMNKEENYLQYDNIEASRRRRLYWLLFVTERAYALQRGRPLTLQASINLPTMTDDPSDPLAPQLNGFVLLVNLFRPFDDVFLSLWNKTRAESSPSYLSALQKQFSDMIPPYMNVQDSDQRANQQWLKTVNWHLSMQNGCVPQGSQEQMPMQYPIDMSRDLMSMTSQFSTHSNELIGLPMVAKLLDISSALIDVLSIMPSSGDPFSMGPREQLNSLLQLLSVLRNGDHHFLPLLLNKVHDVLPRLANPILQRAPENACMQNIDIFDGFGNAGMAQPPMMTDFKTEPYTPGSMQHIQDIGTDSGHSNNGDDMKSPFPMVSSPPMMSPGNAEYHGTDFNSIPDIMSPMGQSSQHGLGQQGPLNPQQPHHQHQHTHPHTHPHPHQHHNLASHNMNQNHNVGNPMQTDMHANLGHALNQPPSIANMGQQQQQSIGQNPQFGMMNNMLHRQPPQRQNSFVMHQQHQHQPSQIPRTVGDFHALQRANSENVSMNSLGLSHMNAEVDFSGLR
ncbi:fungal-specific transcription factor domain-containing protein [Annulohypoxylon maeteangense]|uniref:fungal-specific transcription factor domain-containing protein n=1 Tax=Annulohypoxylon maeteangense TaxID=1927788 RepID=UPI002007AC39|nr:fungal-specific transcription factor domain-containing protein [Annulohypoxylon maeteangense]KAI0884158.1 fungal-specific transcription factor domain-containing protein [Annulohypoxylon maeteangense]